MIRGIWFHGQWFRGIRRFGKIGRFRIRSRIRLGGLVRYLKKVMRGWHEMNRLHTSCLGGSAGFDGGSSNLGFEGGFASEIGFDGGSSDLGFEGGFGSEIGFGLEVESGLKSGLGSPGGWDGGFGG
jgi:hypothetical protein